MTTDEQVRQWWRVMAEHADHGRCRPWAEAFAELIAHDVYHLGPPHADDRPNPTAGETRRTA
ncbi:MAG: hypothetical protein WA890_15325 [Micromonospora sp.]